MRTGLVMVLVAACVGAEELDRKTFNGLKKNLGRAVADSDLEATAAALDGLVDDQSLRAIELFLEQGAAATDPSIQSLCVAAVTRIDAEPALAEAREWLLGKRNDTGERVLLCEAFGTMRSASALNGLIDALQAEEETVQRAALLALGERDEQDALLAIYGLIEREERRRGVLFQLATSIVARRHAADAPRFEPTVTRGPQLFGTEIASQRIVFLLDISESMRQVDEAGGPAESDPEEKEILAAFGIPEEPPTRMRIDRAKHELMRTIALLDEEVSFTVVAFHGVLRRLPTGREIKASPERWLFPWKTKLVSANRRGKSAAIGFISELTANGATYSLAALDQAFQVAEADTFYLLSDGMPTEPDATGTLLSRETILERLQQRNRLRNVVIHTFGFTGRGLPGVSRGMEEGFEEFMQDIADQNSGTYTAID